MRTHGNRGPRPRRAGARASPWLVGALALLVAVAMAGLAPPIARAQTAASVTAVGSATFEVSPSLTVTNLQDLYFGHVVPSEGVDDILNKDPVTQANTVKAGSPQWVSTGHFARWQVEGDPAKPTLVTFGSTTGCTDPLLVFVGGLEVFPSSTLGTMEVEVGGQLTIRNSLAPGGRVPAGHYVCNYDLQVDYQS